LRAKLTKQDPFFIEHMNETRARSSSTAMPPLRLGAVFAGVHGGCVVSDYAFDFGG
jgi:hypothetical protein